MSFRNFLYGPYAIAYIDVDFFMAEILSKIRNFNLTVSPLTKNGLMLKYVIEVDFFIAEILSKMRNFNSSSINFFIAEIPSKIRIFNGRTLYLLHIIIAVVLTFL